MKKATENWLKIAKYDLKTAEGNLKIGQYIAAIEKCHNSLEKLLKGIITENNQVPEKIHNLLKLASEAVIENLKEDIKPTLAELNRIYMHTRYPDEFIEIENEISEPKAREIVTKTKEIFKWLEKRIK